jgi:hypothetical protein
MNTVEYVIPSILGGRKGKVLLGVYKCKVGFSWLNLKNDVMLDLFSRTFLNSYICG